MVKIDAFQIFKTAFPNIDNNFLAKATLQLDKSKQLAYTEESLVLPDGKSFFANAKNTLEIGGLVFPLAVYVNYTAQRTIVKTAVQGKNFGVIEMSDLDNYQVSIKGVATAAEVNIEGYPVYWQEKFRDLLEKNESFEVKNDILNRQGINYLVLESYKPMFETGDSFAFEMEFLSDENIELQLWQS